MCTNLATYHYLPIYLLTYLAPVTNYNTTNLGFYMSKLCQDKKTQVRL